MTEQQVTEKALTAQAIARLSKEMTFTPFANDEAITLSIAIVRNMLAIPTRSNKLPDDNACMRYMMMAKSRALNPFEGDCFLLGFDTQDGPKFEMITAHQAFLKRAEIHPDFDGMDSGVIVREKESKQIVELQGDFHSDDQELFGGWAKVHHKSKKVPTYRRVKLATYRKPFGRWKDDPAGMICKVAESDALRSAFPTKLGGLYLREEIEIMSETEKTDGKQLPPPMFEMPPTEPPKPSVTNGLKPSGDEEASELAGAGMVPEQPPSQPKASAGKNTEQIIAALKERMAGEVTEDQLLAYCRTQKLATAKHESFIQLSDSKLRDLLDDWEALLPELQAVQI